MPCHLYILVYKVVTGASYNLQKATRGIQS